MEQKPDFKKIFLGIILGTAGLAAVIYGGYYYSQKKGFKLTLPTGGGYTGQQSPAVDNPPTAPVRFTAPPDTNWLTYIGRTYNYSFAFPETLTLQGFIDPPDAVGIIWGNLDPKLNLLLDIQSIKALTPQYVGKTEQFVNDWWKFYSGLKGVKSVTKFTNTNGLNGYKAIFIDKSDQSPNVDIFLEIPKNPNLIIHLANGILDPTIFDRIVDSLKYTPPKPTTPPSPTPTGNP